MSKRTVAQILRAPSGGIRKHVYDILSHLQEDDFNQIFITNLKDADLPAPKLKNLEVFHLDIQDQPALKDLFNLFKIYRFLYSRNVDVIHGHGAKGGLYARLVSYFLRARCLYTPHGGSLHRAHGRIKNFVYDAIELFLVPFTDIFLFESKYSRDVFIENVIDVGFRAVVNYNGIDIPKEQATHVYRAGEKLRLGSFGLLRRLKGHDIGIEACALLKKEGIPFEYSIYGQGEEGINLQLLIRKRGLENEVRIFDYSGNVIAEMLKCDFVLQPSRFESFGYVPVEAMSVRVPVLVSYEGGLKEVVNPETGFIAYTNVPSEYAEILREFYLGKKLVQDKINNAYLEVEKKFSLRRMIETIVGLYSS